MQDLRRYLFAVGIFCCVTILAGCVEDDNGVTSINNDEEMPEALQDRCEAACSVIYQDCEQQFRNADDSVMSEPACVDACVNEDKFQDAEWCVATEAQCQADPEQMLESCLYSDKPEDAQGLCEVACDAVYDRCEQVMLDHNNVPISAGACVEECLEGDTFHGGEWCVATEAECMSEPSEMIDSCVPDDYHPPACQHLGAWDHGSATMEEQVVEETNRVRAEGTTCVERENPNDPNSQLVTREMPAVGPVSMDMHLRCAARQHSLDMKDNIQQLSHTGSDGSSPTQRADSAGYTGGGVGENIAWNYQSAAGVVEGWRTSDTGHCSNMMTSSYTDIGVGLTDGWWWTQKFGN